MARSSGRTRAMVSVEVIAVFAAVHVLIRAVMKFTAWGEAEQANGLNIIPGLVMIGATVVLLLIHRRRLSDWGLTIRPVRVSVNVGVLMFAMLAAVGAIVMALGVAVRPSELTAGSALLAGGASLGCTALVMWTLQRWPGTGRGLPLVVSAIIVAAVLTAPIWLALQRGGAAGPVVMAVAWRVIGAGVGEEVFFRGYLQSRLNHAFGRRWRLLGVQFGAGLVIASLLFGLVHALNPVDYFAGWFHFAWWHGLTTALMPYGWLREKTGSVAAGVVLHGLVDCAALVV